MAAWDDGSLRWGLMPARVSPPPRWEPLLRGRWRCETAPRRLPRLELCNRDKGGGVGGRTGVSQLTLESHLEGKLESFFQLSKVRI